MRALPRTQVAVQLVGPGELRLERAKPVPRPGPHEILFEVEAVGLCFSDLKLLALFDGHARKGEVLAGIDPAILAGIQSYVPGERPTVPGHETVGRIAAVGAAVEHHHIGQRCLVQTDYRELRTAGSNAAFGYNFEGGLQEYTLFDERVVLDPGGERFLIPVGEELGASTIALVEPWACVEHSYASPERRAIRPGGRLLLVAERGAEIPALERCYDPAAPPAAITRATPAEVAPLPEEAFDDIIYLGAERAVIEALDRRLAAGGLINLVLSGRRIGTPVSVGVGRLHYGRTRWIGTLGADPAESYRRIPASGELRSGERIQVIGAGGPMGQMHVLRALASGLAGISIVATDLDPARLAALGAKAARCGAALRLATPQEAPSRETFSYFVLMAPIPALVAEAIERAAQGALINVFAGIPAATRHELDLDRYLEKGCYLFGTSGSLIADMRAVLAKLDRGELDTDASVDAISGMAGAIAGIRAVEERRLPGKIVVYPRLGDLGLVPLAELGSALPSVAARLAGGRWCRAAEEELLRVRSR